MKYHETKFVKVLLAIAALTALTALAAGACSGSSSDTDGDEVISEETSPSEDPTAEPDTTRLTCTLLMVDAQAPSVTRSFVDRAVDVSGGLEETELDENLDILRAGVAEDIEDEVEILLGAIRSAVVTESSGPLETPEVQAAIAEVDAWAAAECEPSSESGLDDADS